MTKKTVYQFKITLLDIKPSIWRQIQVPKSYSFRDLHLAIQDAMGWMDSHLHEFLVKSPVTSEMESIGVPEEDGFDNSLLSGSKIKIKKYLPSNSKMRYIYDFGDDWEHELKFEGEYPQLESIEYPLCLAGKRACPPEDIGGVSGYEHFLEAINNPNHEEHQELLDWVGGYFNAEDFDPTQVLFHDPEEYQSFMTEWERF